MATIALVAQNLIVDPNILLTYDPLEVKKIQKELQDVTLKELPIKLSHMCTIQLLHYQMNPLKLIKQVKKLLH